MDGFAVQAASVSSVPVRLKVVGTLAAGVAPSVSVGPGEAVRIMTGAPIPPGADAIVPVEGTAASGDEVEVQAAARGGGHLRPAGEDIAARPGGFPPGGAGGAGGGVPPGGGGRRRGPGGGGPGRGSGGWAVRPGRGGGGVGGGEGGGGGGGGGGRAQSGPPNRHTLLALCRSSGFEAV